tara:strand:- start:1773 stop:2423 length:651 start_codon:yes stop_codon:yes gene_type:complete
MAKYESLLLGGARKKHISKKVESSSESESEEEERHEKMEGGKMHKKKVSGGKMTYEERCANLAKARAKRMSNLKNKKSGKGQYNQDYVDESQINYAGSPLDMYYVAPKKEQMKEKAQRGENTGAGMGDDQAMAALTGGKVKRGRKSKMVLGGDMNFMKNSMHTGMDMPTESEYKKGGKIMKENKVDKVNEFQIDIDGALKHLSMLASRFGLKLVKM